MRPIETAKTNVRIELPGGTEANVLPAQHGPAAGAAGLVPRGDPAYHLPYVASVWEPSPRERAALAVGRNVELVMLATRVPPMTIGVTDEGPTDAPPQSDLDAPSVWLELGEPLIRDLVDVVQRLEEQCDAHVEAGDEIAPALTESVGRLGTLRGYLEAALEELAKARAQEEPDA